jgi:lysophospholipase L1-like esterase
MPAILTLSAAIFATSLGSLPAQTVDNAPAKDFTTRTPANPALSNIFIVGDSTADLSMDPNHEELAGVQGWGVFFPAFFNPATVNVVNLARGGRSSRTYLSEDFWEKVLSMMKPGDIVLIQLGQNGVFPINDNSRARGTIPGAGEESQEIDNMLTQKHEVVHTYGWYIRGYVRDTRAKGATPIVMSLTPRNVWKDDRVEVGVSGYREWARNIAMQEHVDFVDVSAIMAGEFQKFGEDKVNGLYHDHEPVHMTTPGSFMAAECIVAGLKALPDAPVSRYLSGLGKFVPALTPVK